MICSKNSAHGEMMRNGTRGGKQQWYCNECAKLRNEKKKEAGKQ